MRPGIKTWVVLAAFCSAASIAFLCVHQYPMAYADAFLAAYAAFRATQV